jgi:hypothetical protein
MLANIVYFSMVIFVGIDKGAFKIEAMDLAIPSKPHPQTFSRGEGCCED